MKKAFSGRDSMVDTTANLPLGLASKENIKDVLFECLAIFKTRLVCRTLKRSLSIIITVHRGEQYDQSSSGLQEGSGAVVDWLDRFAREG